MASETESSPPPDAAPPAPIAQISLPKGGGALQGIGEKFSTNGMTGTGALTLPIAVSPGRSGFTPQLLLSYDSGGPNDVYGVGMGLMVPAIVCKTGKGLPRYRYDDREESDVFILTGNEDLVPVLCRTDGGWQRDDEERDGFRIRRYRPRIEGLFARIERWTRLGDGDIHWRSFTKDNVQTIYGDTPESRISDPEQPRHIFRWLVSSSYDGKGNASSYEYVKENLSGVDCAAPSERGRQAPANRYLKRVLYGNRTPLCRYRGPPQHPGSSQTAADWMFEVLFDYGDAGYRTFHDADGDECVSFDTPGAVPEWPVRRDPFSSYRSGFEIRTYRLCRRVLMFHHFPHELGPGRYLVRSTEFHYDEKPLGSFLTRVVQSGYSRLTSDTYRKRSLPALDLSYTRSPLEDENPEPFELEDAQSENLPQGIDGQNYRWVDLDGEGIAGVLSEQNSAWYFKRNLGHGRFGRMSLVARKPVSAALNTGAAQLLDVGGEGQLDLVDLAPGVGGFYERTRDPDSQSGLESGWGRFRPFRALPRLDWANPDLRFIDLTGDGIPDILITEDMAFLWHPSLLEEGFGPAVRIPAPPDEDEGPRIVFSDPTQSIYLADMSGDGLTDIVRIRNGEVCYWPNLGYGRFGAKIILDQSPWFDAVDLFDSKQIRLADTDGSGTTDILYISASEIHVYLNQSGNSLSPRRILQGLPAPGARSVSVVDFLGRGTACLVWSSPLRSHAQQPLRYVDLMRGKKPHLLSRIANNMGAETVIEYASSTEFYLADRAAGQPWITSLPFPVYVVKRVEVFDRVSRHRFVSTSSYHHGYYDGVEREFRGFARIDQLDTEEYGSTAQRPFPAACNEEAPWSVPPVLTKTWNHTGVFLGADRISRLLGDEYYHAPGEGAADRLADTVLPSELLPEQAREACRSLQGMTLRQEVYALDGSAQAERPYTVAESNATIRLLQPRGCNLHCVFFTHARETVAVNFERRLYRVKQDDGAHVSRADPRVTHSVTLAVDPYGNVLESVAIAYGRRFPDRSGLLSAADRATQSRLLASATHNRYTNAVETPECHRTPLIAESQAYELVHLERGPTDRGTPGLLRFSELRRQVARAGDGTHDLPFEDFTAEGAVGEGPYRRLIQHSRTLYRSDDLRELLPLGELESLALQGERYSLMLTSRLLRDVYGSKLPEPGRMLAGEGGYFDLDEDGRWWAGSGRVFYSSDSDDVPAVEDAYARRHFYLPRRFRDVFGNISLVTYDAHDLAPVLTRDPLGNLTRAVIDYRVLLPSEVTDANGNRTQSAFDALARLAGTAVMGKAGEPVGDSLEGFVADLSEHLIIEHLRNPLADPQAILGQATTRLIYDPFVFARGRDAGQPQPAVTYSLARETHVSALASGERTKIQHAFVYSDGFGRDVQHKVQADPDGGPRWIGTGWMIFNNKGKPVKRYEPFFSGTHGFEFAATVGVAATLLYDPLGRVCATLNPNHTFAKTIIDPWCQESWDANDTVLIHPLQDQDIGSLLRRIPSGEYSPTWYEQRAGGQLGTPERDAARKAAEHANTPMRAFADPLGRAFVSVAHNRAPREGEWVDEFQRTHTELDIQGNQRSVRDALGRVIMRYDYDFGRRRIHQNSSDAGQSWIVSDINGKPLLTADSREYRLRYEYDALRRPTALFVKAHEGAEHLAERTEYGESQTEAAAHNLRTRPYRHFDGAGLVTMPEYDFKGNLLRSSRRMLVDYQHEVDWAASPELERTVLSSATAYDALNRPTELTSPDSSVIHPTYNETNLLQRLEVRLKGKGRFIPFVRRIIYNPKGQRERVDYGNGTRTANSYDPLTFRLAQLKTTRDADRADLQDLSYTYDPVGNIASIADAAQQTFYFRNQAAKASADYLYDAVYRLIDATGREYSGLRGFPQTTWSDAGRVHLPLPGDGHSMRNYREHYHYDAAGNIQELQHNAGSEGSWKRRYEYDEYGSNNRLTRVIVGQLQEEFAYDPNGNMTRMSHLPLMRWDFKDQLASTGTQVVQGEGGVPTTYYNYDLTGLRVRKITTDGRGRRRAERLYVGGFEIYREFGHDGESITLERTSLNVMDDKRRIALVESQGEETTIRYQFDNHLGSACLELDEEAAILTYEEYYPYGSTSYQAGRSETEASLKRYRFTGKERDAETGLYYQTARYYAPWLGRWTSCDPSGLVDGLNQYQYVLSNPIGATDPTGRWSTGWTIAAVVGVVVVVAVISVVTLGAGAGPAAAGGAALLTAGAEAAAGTTAVVAAGAEVAAGTTAVIATGAEVAGGATALATAGTEVAAGTTAAVTAGAETAATTTAAVAAGGETAAATTAAATTGAEVTASSTAAATTGVEASAGVSGLTASQATGIGTAATAVGIASQTPAGQAVVESVEENLPELANEAEVVAQEAGAEATEVYYRTMSQAHFEELTTTGNIPATGETFVSPSLEYASKYEGVTVGFNVASGTTDSLLDIGVRSSNLTTPPYGSLDLVDKGWTAANAFFKLEKGVLNIGLGQGAALDLFNDNIINFSKVPE